jgi:hypothetical protein
MHCEFEGQSNLSEGWSVGEVLVLRSGDLLTIAEAGCELSLVKSNKRRKKTRKSAHIKFAWAAAVAVSPATLPLQVEAGGSEARVALFDEEACNRRGGWACYPPRSREILVVCDLTAPDLQSESVCVRKDAILHVCVDIHKSRISWR